MRPFAIVLLVAALAGCSEDEAGPTSCPSVEGTFRGVWTERQGGTCGPVDARTLVIGDQGTSEGLPSAFVCEEPVTSESADGCNLSVLTKCATKDGAESFREILTFVFAKDGGTFTAEDEIQWTGANACKSTYDVTYTKK